MPDDEASVELPYDGSLPANEEMARAMKHQAPLLRKRLGRHEPHVWPRNRLAKMVSAASFRRPARHSCSGPEAPMNVPERFRANCEKGVHHPVRRGTILACLLLGAFNRKPQWKPISSSPSISWPSLQ
jgi:hypothetical protein